MGSILKAFERRLVTEKKAGYGKNYVLWVAFWIPSKEGFLIS